MLIILLILTISKAVSPECSNEMPRLPKYHLIEKCHRSTLTAIAKANYTSLASCQKLALEKKGLAFNFSPPEVGGYVKGDEGVEFTCEVLKCAEASGGLSLKNDTRFDYYSIYARFLPDKNATCVPGIGMFRLLTQKQNYSSIVEVCKNMSGVLADVLSELRTDALAQLLAGSETKLDVAYVGLESLNGSDFLSVNGDKLDCTTYRAWAPGHPKRHKEKYGCVGLTRGRTWKSYPCKMELAALCELSPSGPYKKGTIFASRTQNVTDENKIP